MYVDNKVPCEQSKVGLSLKSSAILENNNLQYYVSHEYSTLVSLLLTLLLIISLLNLLIRIIFVILFNKEWILTDHILVHVCYKFKLTVFTFLENDCNLFEKAVQLSVDVNVFHNKSSMSKQECLRSRYAQFLASQCIIHKTSTVHPRSR